MNKWNFDLKNKKTLFVVAILVFVIFAGIAILAECQESVSSNEESIAKNSQEQYKLILSDELAVVSMGKYSGPYWEDGSNEDVKNIQMMVLKNTSDQDIQYAEITIEHKNGTAQYAITNLPSGECVQVLEKNRMKYTRKDVIHTSLSNVALLDKMPMHEKTFDITGLEGVINIKNISQDDIKGTIYVYYKNVGEDMYLGGITYRIKIEDGMKAGEIKQLGAGHYNADKSEILMVTYAE